MSESSQATSGELRMVVHRACHEPGCPNLLKLDCPDHARSEDKGVVVTFGQHAEST
jgi:hypothetical protein